MLEGVLGSIRAKPELEKCTQGADVVQRCWLDRERLSVTGSSAGPGTLGVNGKCTSNWSRFGRGRVELG